MSPRIPRPPRNVPLPSHPRFITLEGGEGAGKTTVLKALRDALESQGAEVICTREPGGTPFAESIRRLLLGAPADGTSVDGMSVDGTHEALSAETELLLMFAARVQHVRETIRPALERGAWVLSDRFTDSSYAYQGGGRGLDPGFIAELERRVVDLQPALTLLLDVGVAQGRERTRSRDPSPDRIESERDDFFERVRDSYLARAQAEPERFRVIDAAHSIERVAAAAVRHLQDWQAGS